MKHGDKAKKSAKAVKASGKKSSSKEVVAKARKESGSSKTSSKEAGSKAVAQKAGAKTESKPGEAAKGAVKTAAKAPAKDTAGKGSGGGNGKAKAGDTGGSSFANPVVGAAFKRAVKKYSNAFRRLTD